MCSVVGHFLLSGEHGFQLCDTERSFDAVADGLQPIKTRENKCDFKKIIPGQKKYLKLESGKNKFNSGF